MPGERSQVVRLPDDAWRDVQVLRAWRTRDFRAFFHLACNVGLTPEIIAQSTSLPLDLVINVMKGNATLASLRLIESVAGGLEMPDHVRKAVGLAPQAASLSPDSAPQLPEIRERQQATRARNRKSVGVRIAALRRERGLTQESLAERAGVSSETIRKLEQQARTPSLAMLDTLANALEVSAGELIDSAASRRKTAEKRERPPDYLPAEVLARPDFTRACHERDLGAMFTIATEAGFTDSHLARRCEMTPSRVADYMRRGRQAISVDVFERVSEGLGIPGEMLGLGSRLLQPAESGQSVGEELKRETSGHMNREDEEMERRRLLQSLAALGITVSPATRALESIRGSFGVAFAHDDRAHLDDWEETIIEYGYAYLATPPATLIQGLASDLVAGRSIVARTSSHDNAYRGWCRIGGILSGLMAKSLSNLGDPGDSRHWWNMAQHVADSSGDLNLSLWVRGQRVIHGLYENRPNQLLKRQLAAATGFANGYTCAGLADVSTARAQVSALSGDYKSAEEELHRTGEILDRLPRAVTEDTSSVMGWGEAQLRYTETWVYAYMGDEVKTDQAAQRALQLYPATDSRSPAQINLMRAFARIRRGDITEGVRYAQATYEPLASGQSTTMVDALARRVLTGVPDEARNRPDVAAYRAVVAQSSQRMIES